MSGLWKRKKPAIIIVLIIAILFISAASVLVFKYNSTKNEPFKTTDKVMDIKVSEGESLYSVLDKLKNENVLKSPLFTKLYLKINGSTQSIKPGDYEIPANITLKKFLDMLVDGKVAGYKVTFPEGFTIEQIADRLASDGIIQKDVFLNAVKSYPLPNYITPNPEKRYNLEGFLYPDTYEISKGATADNIISMMLNKFEEVMKKAQKDTGVNISEKDYEKYVTIASMIEKEAATDEDRELVSSVIYNRLEKGMQIQVDATVLYALGHHKDKVYLKDLKTKSPYNTYYIPALPIGPIANPGIESIEAALKPAKTNYLYYLLAVGKEHYFTDNYADFEKAKKELGY